MVSFDYDASDPLSVFMLPPANETPEEKAEREAREAEAQRISDAIDEDLKKERAALKREKKIAKVLLLGQSESGKSTTLKNFRMQYTPAAWKAERASWRAVVQLNLVHSVNIILHALHAEMTGQQVASDDGEDDSVPAPTADEAAELKFTEKHDLLKLRLRPLADIERDLKRKLGASAEELRERSNSQSATPFDSQVAGASTTRRKRMNEFTIHSWKNPLERSSTESNSTQDKFDEATTVIAGCRDDMQSLWDDAVVRKVLVRRNIRLENTPGFFLDDLKRIANADYEPSDDDVVRARLRTMGVVEHRLRFEQAGYEWRLYDVGGSRTQRAAWLPFFENVNAVIFLAPISCFNERLAEDSRVNRLEDSFLLWKSVCSSKLLAKATMVIFLNKCDLLDRKLRQGVKINKYLPSYGDRENNMPTVVKYLRQKVKDMLKQHSPEPRACYAYATSVTDTKATATTLSSVRDGILRGQLKQAEFV
ncbi:hypothetical protein PLICRDRAFT_507933 [Plicaturopsis crispa FD-325 SS-3]|nr:hypothetical protein PLICRDRAFT_507933 [Plicaturopsis crispa FD-325 SS-3]